MQNYSENEIEQACQNAMSAIKSCIALRDYINAEKLIEQYLKVRRDSNARQFASMIKMNLGKYHEAKSFCIENLSYNKNPDDYTNLALIERSLYNLEGAFEYARLAHALKPESAAITANYSIICHAMKKNKMALDLIDKSISIEPNSWMYYFNKASILCAMGKNKEAITYYEKTLSINPLEINTNIDYFYCLAKCKMYKKAWPFYEYRYSKIKSLHNLIKKLNKPILQIKSNSYDQKICIIPEQGLGDNLMFLRFVVEFQKIAPNSYFFCPEPLKDFCEKLNIRFSLSALEDSEYLISIMSLPYHLNSESLPPQNFLVHKTKKESEKINVGICWAGSPMHPMDKFRSTYLTYFSPFLNDKSFQVFSFQKEKSPRKYASSKKIYDYAKGMEKFNIIDLSSKLHNAFDTAKMISNMDIFISVDTFPAHISGFVDVKSFVLVGEQSDWRWGTNESTSDWYRNIHIIRKKKNQSYKKLIESLYKKIKSEI